MGKKTGEEEQCKKISIYQAMDERIIHQERDDNLTYTQKDGSASYENALNILQQIGWHHTATYETNKYPRKQHINWKATKWREPDEEIDEEQELEVNFWAHIGIIRDEELAISSTTIGAPKEQSQIWVNILGRKITQNPQNMEGVACTIGLEIVGK